MNIVVRRAERDDASAIGVCLQTLGYDTPISLVIQRLEEFRLSSFDAVFVAEKMDDQSLSGVISGHALPLFHTQGMLVRITSLAVRPEAQGNGVGQALVNAIEAWAWRLGARRVEVTSGDHRLGAHAFYQAIGYVLDERRFIKHAKPA